jgi:predicted flap endonuclease-1-like 5' DNA nuclease
MAIPVSELKGIGSSLVQKLERKGIVDSDHLLDAAKSPAERANLADKVGVESRAILELANRADLSRVNGVAGVYSDMLEHAGVDTVKELATRRPENLQGKIEEVNSAHQLSDRTPTLAMVEDWVDQAKTLPKLLTY